MRRKLIAAMLGTVLAAGVLGSCALAEEAGAEGGVSVRENEESITGYTADFVYEDENATDVKLVGGFQFYKSGDIRVYANGFWCFRPMMRRKTTASDRTSGSRTRDGNT